MDIAAFLLISYFALANKKEHLYFEKLLIVDFQ
jgi:hypothetical protein